MNYWPADLAHRAPVNDFPPAWASAWGEDRYGLWADLEVQGITQRMRWIEPTVGDGSWIGADLYERENVSGRNTRTWVEKSEIKPFLVKIAPGFWLGDTPCTQAFWLAVVGGVNPSHFRKGAHALRRPVEQVPWFDDKHGKGVSGFLAALNRSLASTRASLPTEAEWEYACRAGTRTAYWWGDNFDPNRANANHGKTKGWGSIQGTTSVDRYPPNPWGLFDMHGNVWEWCSDPWRELGEEGEPQRRNFVARGGSWLNRVGLTRSASRGGWSAVDRGRVRGFRITLRTLDLGLEGGD
jgi:formylglycine-generating enzyme required for sulfatase activity